MTTAVKSRYLELYGCTEAETNRPVLWARKLRDSRLTLATKSVLMCLATYVPANRPPPWRCYPAVETLAKDAGMGSLATCRKALRELARLGYIADTGQRTGRTASVVVWEILRDNDVRDQLAALAIRAPKRIQRKAPSKVAGLRTASLAASEGPPAAKSDDTSPGGSLITFDGSPTKSDRRVTVIEEPRSQAEANTTVSRGDSRREAPPEVGTPTARASCRAPHRCYCRDCRPELFQEEARPTTPPDRSADLAPRRRLLLVNGAAA